MTANSNNDVIKLVDDKYNPPNSEHKESNPNEVVIKDEKGKFGLSQKDIQLVIDKYDKREFIEEVEDLIEKGGNSGIEKMLLTNFDQGLNETAQEMQERIAIFGVNALEQEPLPHCCEYVWEALGDYMLRILIVAAIIQIALGASPLSSHPDREWVEGFSILMAVGVVVSVGSITNYSKEKKFKELNDRNAAMVKIQIKRGGVTEERSPDDVLVGDIVKIVTGSLVPADGILISCEGQVKIEESALTGESDLIEKEPIDICLKKARGFRGTPNKHTIASPLIFSGTQVKEGAGWFVAWAVGTSSKKGQIEVQVQQNQENDDSKTPLEIKLDKIASDIGWFGIVAGVLTLISLLIRFGVNFAKKKQNYNSAADKSKLTPPTKTVSNDILKIILLCVAIVVVAIPEGLPLAVTLTLAFSIGKMMNDNNLVRKMHACETMGGATYICSDKTGTLTANIMNIFSIYDGFHTIDTEEPVRANMENDMLEKKKDEEYKKSHGGKLSLEMQNRKKNIIEYDYSKLNISENYFNLLKNSITCNLQMTISAENEIINPSKTDLSFANLMKIFKVNLYSIIQKYRIDQSDLKRIPFDSDRKKMTTVINHSDFPTGWRVFNKGAAELVVPCCSHLFKRDTMEKVNKTDLDDGRIKSEIEKYAKKSYRCIALAYKDISASEAENFLNKVEITLDGGEKKSIYTIEQSDFTLLCIAGIKDTLRDGVPEAIQQCGEAGITVVMVTGDLKETAVAISKECKIWKKKEDEQIPENYSLTGVDFYNRIGGIICEICNKRIEDCTHPKTKSEARRKKISEDLIQRQKIANFDEFKKIAKDLRVLARSRPLDKYALVMGLRKMEHVVAVTGDGTNDAQALSKSDVGFAMGQEGTDVAKDAADIIILDDNFASIVRAVVWGRNIYDCIRKFIQFQLTVNVTACVLVFVTACIGNETPITAIQMLWLNMIMDSFGSIALATESPHEKILKRAPNSKKEYIINYMMWKHIIGQAIVLFTILIVIYLDGKNFIPEDHPQRIEEMKLVHKCFGKWPGRNHDDLVKEDKYYILSGSIVDWPSTQVLKDGLTQAECGRYAKVTDMSFAHKEFISSYGNSSHMTIMFNIFVYFTLFNQLNSRNIVDEYNILKDLTKNPYFLFLQMCEGILQAIIIQFGSVAFSVSLHGLTARQWGICFGFAALSLPTSILLKSFKIEVCMEASFNFILKFVKSNKVEKSDEKPDVFKNDLEKKASKDQSSGSRRKTLVEGVKTNQLEHKQSSRLRVSNHDPFN